MINGEDVQEISGPESVGSGTKRRIEEVHIHEEDENYIL